MMVYASRVIILIYPSNNHTVRVRMRRGIKLIIGSVIVVVVLTKIMRF